METQAPTPTTALPKRTHDDDSKNEEEDEMPLLFMDGLPSNFQRNAQLAALVTFMGSDDDDETKENEDDPHQAYGKSQSSRQRRAARQRQRPCTQPYATREDKKKALDDAKESHDAKKPPKPTTKTQDATKELQLYLSMFTVSSSN